MLFGFVVMVGLMEFVLMVQAVVVVVGFIGFVGFIFL